MGGQYLNSIQMVLSLRALILILGIGLAASHDIYPEGEELKPDVHEFKRSADPTNIRIMKKANNEIRIMKKANNEDEDMSRIRVMRDLHSQNRIMKKTNNEIRIMKKANNEDVDMSRIRVMRDLHSQNLIRVVRSYLDNTNRVIRVMKKRASGDTAAASDDSDKIRVMRSSDGILQLLPPLAMVDKKFKRGKNHTSDGQKRALGNPYILELRPRVENLHVWRRNFKKDPREIRIMKKSYISEDYL